MTWVYIVLVSLGWALLTLWVDLRARKRDRRRALEGYYRGLGTERERLRELIVRGRAGKSRAEILLSDWGEEHADMRWRWTIWDADALVWTEVATAPRQKLGFEVPLMLGNAPSKAGAALTALGWILDQENLDSITITTEEQF